MAISPSDRLACTTALLLLLMMPVTLPAQEDQPPAAADAVPTASSEDAEQPPEETEAREAQQALRWTRLFPGFALYPFAPTPGWPGAKEPEPKMPPEFQPYPGSVEHYRHDFMKYIPAIPIYNARSLRRNWPASELASDRADRLADYAERDFRYKFPNDKAWQTRGDRGQFRAPVKTVRLSPGDAPLTFTLGKLPAGLFNLRVIAAVNFNEDTQPPKEQVFELRVNDRPDGSESVHILRGRTMSNFYPVVEFFIYTFGDREVKASLTYRKESAVAMYVHNVDLHDVLAETKFAAVKKRQTGRHDGEDHAAIARLLQQESAQNDRFVADQVEKLHQSMPPVNTMYFISHMEAISGNTKRQLGDSRVAPGARMWKYEPGGTFRMTRSSQLAKLDNVKAPAKAKLADLTAADPDEMIQLEDTGGKGTVYDWKDLASRKVLPGVGDIGVGVRTGGERFDADLAIAVGLAYVDAMNAGVRDDSDRGDLFSRAFMLALAAYRLPTLSFSHHLTHQVGVWAPDRLRAAYNYTVWSRFDVTGMVESYDRLYPYISQSRKLAAALRQYIPWINSPEDVVKLFDTFLVQHYAKQITYFRIYGDGGMAANLFEMAIMLEDNDVSSPWFRWLENKFWVYPQALGGFMDLNTIQTTRDGGTTIGSYFYAMGPSIHITQLLDRYHQATGDPRYNVRDPLLYPKAWAALRYPFEMRVAGYHNPGIGDVGGPSTHYMRWSEVIGETAGKLHEWTGDPRYLHLHERHEKRRLTSDAAKAVRDPVLVQRSRVLADWMAVLEAGTEHDDPRARAAVAVNVGPVGAGHSHADTLDLRLFAHGMIMSGDAGMRPEYGTPTHGTTRVHNVVEIDGRNFAGYAWATNLADMPAARYLAAEAAYPDAKVTRFARQVSMVKLTAGDIPPGDISRADDWKAVTPEHYVLDVFRVAGGKVHTYCFHGGVDDEFTTNATEPRRPTGPRKEYLKEFYFDQKYYDAMGGAFTGTGRSVSARMEDAALGDGEFSLEEKPKDKPKLWEPWEADVTGDVLEATWRLERKSEERMLSGVATATAPRKFTRMSLLDAKGLAVMHGICISSPSPGDLNAKIPHYAVRNLYAQKTGQSDQTHSVFVAVLEPYAGESKIKSKRLLPVTAQGDGADRAVAVEVKSTGGRADVSWFDAQPDQARRAGDAFKAQAEYAFLSRDEQGVVQASIAGGTLLESPAVTLKLASAAYQARMVEVDYPRLRARIDQRWPQLLAGSYLLIGNEHHKTGYTVTRIESADKGAWLHFDKSIELYRSRIMYREGQAVHLAVAQNLRHGQRKGLTATDEQHSRIWRAEAKDGGNRWEGYGITLTGDAIPDDMLQPGDGLVVQSFGPSDAVTRPTYATIRRHTAGTYFANANAPFELRIAGKAASVSLDGIQWRALRVDADGGFIRATLDPASLGATAFQVRVEQ